MLQKPKYGIFNQNDSEQAIYLEYNGDKNGNFVPDPNEIGIKPLNGDGDFRSKESIDLLTQSDIVVTNPSFSLFREFVAQRINTILTQTKFGCIFSRF